jgi:hypothetical protein
MQSLQTTGQFNDANSPKDARPEPLAKEAPQAADLEKTASVSSDAQAGVQNIEAATSVWTKWHLVAAYGM